MRLVDPPFTLGVLWGYVVPETPQGASKLEFIGALKWEPNSTVLSVNAFPNGNDIKTFMAEQVWKTINKAHDEVMKWR